MNQASPRSDGSDVLRQPHESQRLSDLRTFVLILAGQLVAGLGNQIAIFGLGVWLFQRTGSITVYSLALLATIGTQVLVSPFAGVLVDRWDRRHVLLLSHAGAGLCSIVLVLLHVLGRLEPWNTLALIALASAFNAPQFPAFAAATTLLVPPGLLPRANGLVQLSEGVKQALAPVLAAFLLGPLGLGGLFAISVGSFLLTMGVLLVVHIPRPPDTHVTGVAPKKRLLEEAGLGWRFIHSRPGMTGLLLLSMLANFSLGLVQVLFTPLVLSFASLQALGLVHSTGGLGFIVGSVLMTLWGGPQRHIRAVLGFLGLHGMLLLLAGIRPSIALAMVGTFGVLFTVPLIGSNNQTIWQRQTPAGIQGRVFATRLVAHQLALVLAATLAGPLAERVFEPLLAPGGALASSVGLLIGIGPGRGTAFLICLAGSLTMVAALLGALDGRIRRIEDFEPAAEPLAAAPARAAP